MKEKPIVEIMEMKNWGINKAEITPTASVIVTEGYEDKGLRTAYPIATPFAKPRKMQAQKARKKRPPNSPSNGPDGLIVRTTPNSNSLK